MQDVTLSTDQLNHFIDWCVWCGFQAGQFAQGDMQKEMLSIKQAITRAGKIPAYMIGEQ